MFESRVLLDTCALLWLVSGDRSLSANVLEQIENASIVYVSAIPAWEISLKYERKQLILPMEAEEWFNRTLEKHSLVLVPLDISILCTANKLLLHHRDPADRFIIATAMKLKASIATADRNFLKYNVKVLI
jgi:PIN domain nuclease of toxin-antitoxin system